MQYHHPQAATIKEEAISKLKYSQTAARLLEAIEKDKPLEILVFSNPQARPFALDTQTLLLCVPASKDHADIEQVIDLAGGIVEIDMLREGRKRPQGSPDDEETLQGQHLYNLEVILGTFPIAAELEEEGYKAELSLRKNGLGKLYAAWRKEAEYQEFVNLYWDMFNSDKE